MATEHHLHLPSYNLCLKNHKSGVHGGVGLYINNTIKYQALTDLYHPELEVLWALLRPKRLPRGFPCIVSGTVYHTLYPDGASDAAMMDYLISTLTTIEGHYPGCGILLSGDFNRLNTDRLLLQFRLRQLVHIPTRGDSPTCLKCTTKILCKLFHHLVCLTIWWSYSSLSHEACAISVVVVLSIAGIIAPVINASLARILALLIGLF